MSSIYRLASPIFFVLLASSGCGSLWGTYSEPDPENCVRNPNACQAGEHCNMETQACEPTDLTPVDPFPGPMAPTTFISPGGSTSMLSTPRAARYTLASPKPATIYYTIDGSTPVMGVDGTLSAQNKVTLGPLPDNTLIRWFGDYGPSFNPEELRSFTASVSTATPTTAGSISEDLAFAINDKDKNTVVYNLGPVIIVPRGSRLSLRLNFQAWAAQGSSDKLQYVVSGQGIGALGCLDNVQNYGPYPGQALTLFTTFNAPFYPGHYPLVAGVVAQSGCSHALTASGPEIAQIFVQ